jgi:hypothetical protein
MKVNIEQNWLGLIKVIRAHISEPRATQLIKLYTKYEDRIKRMPASTKMQFHSAFEGGYVYHVLNVINAALKINEVWIDLGVKQNYTKEELVFSALNHDLGKIGDGDEPYYIPNPSEWHVKNQGAIYTVNDKLPFMSIHDRSLYLLQKYDIKCTYNETIAIRLHGGLWDEGTKEYLVGYNKPVTSIPYIIHQADLAASRIEYEQFHLFADKKPNKTQIKANVIASNSEADNLKNILKSL